MGAKAKQAERVQINTGIPRRGAVAVTMKFTAVYGADPSKLPVPGDAPVLGVVAPKSALDEVQYMLEDGTVWEYRGISGYRGDNADRVNGWQPIGRVGDVPVESWADTLDTIVAWEVHGWQDERGITRAELLAEVRCYERYGDTQADEVAKSIERLKQRGQLRTFDTTNHEAMAAE